MPLPIRMRLVMDITLILRRNTFNRPKWVILAGHLGGM
jgi:hypothetical protein